MLDAGDFATWLDDTHAALRGQRGADVPCGSCIACCTASQFIHIGPACSIYEHRLRTGRTYDCRVFAAADVDPVADGVEKSLIAQQVRRWQFTVPVRQHQ